MMTMQHTLSHKIGERNCLDSGKHNCLSVLHARPLAVRLAIVLLLLAAGATTAMADFHKKGASDRPLKDNGYGIMMQDAPTMDYYLYVNTSEKVVLPLPMQDYTGKGQREYRGYYRWYKYSTDKASDKLTKVGTALNSSNTVGNVDYGMVAVGLSANITHNLVGVKYNVPKEAVNNADWVGDTIACDISRYKDYKPTSMWSKTTTVTTEPTLSARVVIHILPAKKLADDLKAAACIDDGKLYEYHGLTIVGLKDENAEMNLQTKLHKADRYFFYEQSNYKTHHVFANDKNHQIVESDFATSVTQAQQIIWRIYDTEKDKWCEIAGIDNLTRFLKLSITKMKSATWYDLDGNKTTAPDMTNWERMFYVVAYAAASNSSKRCPLASYELDVKDYYPMTKEELSATQNKMSDRLIVNLNARYELAMAPLSFDDPTHDGSTNLNKPTSATDNMAPKPLPFDQSAFGYVYPTLAYNTSYDPLYSEYGLMPMQEDYGLYKTANVAGVSYKDTNTGYPVWYYGTTPLYDRTYENSGGTQYGYFYYTNAADEARQIAYGDFQANLCTGAQLVFSAAVADLTGEASTRANLRFVLYGLKKDADGNVTEKTPLQTFLSGDFKTNTSAKLGVWYQIFGRFILQQGNGSDCYDCYRIAVDNMCESTEGADYAIDDIRVYIKHANLDMVQTEPLCPSDAKDGEEAPSKLMFKMRGLYESLLAKNYHRTGKVFYRLCDEYGTPVKLDYDGDGEADDYGEAEVPATYDATRKLGEIDNNQPMFETDSYGDRYIVLAYRHFPLIQGKKYFISVAPSKADDASSPDTDQWGQPSDVCSVYSKMFTTEKQTVVLNNLNGSVFTQLEVECNATEVKSYTIKATLQTADTQNGGSILLPSVTFDWFQGVKNESTSGFSTITGLQEALKHFRDAYPTSTTLISTAKGQYTSEDHNILNTYVKNKRLKLLVSSQITEANFTFEKGTYMMAAIPTTDECGDYKLCPEPMEFEVRVVEKGPQVEIGFRGVPYPLSLTERAVRIGLPQLKAMVNGNGGLKVNIVNVTVSGESNKTVEFTDDEKKIIVSDSNDPNFKNKSTQVGEVSSTSVLGGTDDLDMQFNSEALKFHEGYWYELHFQYHQKSGGTGAYVTCPGETYFKLKIVPEYATWNTRQDTQNANWNNDANWTRSTAKELYKTDYTDYGATATYNNTTDNTVQTTDATTGKLANDYEPTYCYAPMKFTKVTVANQEGKTYPLYPDMGYMARTPYTYTYTNSSGASVTETNYIASTLTNCKGEPATENIEYDMMVKWSDTTSDHSDDGKGNFTCEPFYGNHCDEIYLKPHAELLDACFLEYNKAYVETELQPNKWYAMSSPLKQTYSGDFYLPKTGRQETEAFKPIVWDDTKYSRNDYPVYQRNWDGQGQEVTANGDSYSAYDRAGLAIDTIATDDMKLDVAYWSHIHNKVDVQYTDKAEEGGAKSFALKAGDERHATEGALPALFRLPKADTSYSYYNHEDKKESGATATALEKDSIYKMVVNYNNTKGGLSAIKQPLTWKEAAGRHDDNRYYMVGNPYTATLSLHKLLAANPQFERKVWTMDNGEMKAQLVPATYSNETDVKIYPMQAFFLKLKENETAPDEGLSFSAAMTIDRWLNTADMKPRKDASVTITATSPNGGSTATVIVRSEASDGYADDEDVELLDNHNLDGAPQVYTVATDQAVAVNAVTQIGYMALGVAGGDGETVSVRLKGTGSIAQQLYVYDALTRSSTPVDDETTISMVANCHGRYYLTTTRIEEAKRTDAAQAAISCYSPSRNTLVVASPCEGISQVSVYSMGGDMVANATVGGEPRTQLTLPSGLYVVKVATSNGTVTEKVNIK